MLQDSPDALVWISTHLPAVGWPALLYAVWRITRFATIVENRVLGAEGHVTRMAEVSFPKMEASLATQDGLLNSIDGSLKTLVRGDATDRKRRTPKKAIR